MTTRQALGRHRATPVRTNPLESISKAVSSNAGSVGRQAAVIAAASGLVLSIGVPAQATPATREASDVPASDVLHAERAASVTTATVEVPAASKSEPATIKVASIKDATDGSAYRADKRTERKEAAERAEAREAAAERAEAREAAADRAEASEAAAERRKAAAQRDAASSQPSTTSASSSSSRSTSSAPESTSNNSVNTASSNTPKPAKKDEASKSAPKAASTGSSNKEAAISWALATASNNSIGYSLGANGPSAYDCSSFVQSAFAKSGISVPRTSGGQAAGNGKRVPISDLQRGDLVFSGGGSVHHVAIYLGGGQVVHARNPDKGISTTPISYVNNMSSYGMRY